jgi:hypothetical protein
MRIGVYVDGYNLYYGARRQCGRGTAGWRWLDVRALTQPLVGWRGATVARVVYCTARVDPADAPGAARDQSIYLEALLRSRSVDEIAEGRYVSWAKEEPLVNERSGRPRPTLYQRTDEQWDQRLPVRGVEDSAMVMATVRKREEKGSDVNVASHLLLDVLTGRVDGAVVVSNDSDLETPLRFARERVPVGTVNPSSNPTAGALKGIPTQGAGGHWWRRLGADDFRAAQLPDIVDSLHKPAGW